MKQVFVTKKFRAETLELIAEVNRIAEEYETYGLKLTLRQIHYRLVSGDYPYENTAASYNRLGSILNDARLAGLVDWAAMEDRTRELGENSHWNSPADMVNAAYASYKRDKWADQEYRVEVWVEKQALESIAEKVALTLDVPYFACRGYPSASSLYEAGHRMRRYYRLGQEPVIIHLGDHDPSGIDMTRDLYERVKMFSGDRPLQVVRAALNMPQIEALNPPPNFAKETDSRHGAYAAKYGTDSWELDAVEPLALMALICSQIRRFRDDDRWEALRRQEATERAELKALEDNWEDIAARLYREELVEVPEELEDLEAEFAPGEDAEDIEAGVRTFDPDDDEDRYGE